MKANYYKNILDKIESISFSHILYIMITIFLFVISYSVVLFGSSYIGKHFFDCNIFDYKYIEYFIVSGAALLTGLIIYFFGRNPEKK